MVKAQHEIYVLRFLCAAAAGANMSLKLPATGYWLLAGWRAMPLNQDFKYPQPESLCYASLKK